MATTMRYCELVTNLTDKEGNQLFDMENMKKVLSERACMESYAYIIHDRDTYTAEDESGNPEHRDGSLKNSHIHLLMHFSQPQHTKNIAQWFGIPENFISRIHGTFDDALLYLIHNNTPEKYQYDPAAVQSSFDYGAFLEETLDENGNRKKKKKRESPIDPVIDKILSGKIREYNKTLEIDKKLLVSYAPKINEAFKVRSEYLQATCKDRHTECIYITGESGCGKTTLARKIAQERGLDYFISSGSNDIMDGYAQEPCLIVDDIRPSSLGLSDLLKMLDPHVASSIKSRYKNKYLNCELVILTTVLDINTFYSNVFAEHDEPVIQLKRRCGTYIKMDMQDIFISLWDRKAMHYTPPVCYKNNVLEQYLPEKRKTADDVQEHVQKTMPFLELSEDEIVDTGVFRLQKVHDMGRPEQTEEARRLALEKEAGNIISDETFRALMAGK